MKINKTNIGKKTPPYIIGEMSGNHNQSLDRALKIVETASQIGIHAIKLQTYTADTITLNIQKDEFFIKDEKSLWGGRSLYDLYDEAHTPWDWHEPIMKKANQLGLTCFSSPFDETAVDFLEDLNVPAYKIASPEIIHLPLVEKVASTGKPMIVSTGMATFEEIIEAVEVIKKSKCDKFALLKCTSDYPASSSNSNILTIPELRKIFKCEVGLSDHTMGIGAAVASVAHGSTIIEKHFTLNRSDGGVDSAFSLDQDEMKNLVVETKRAWKSLGKVNYGPTEPEKENLKYRRSIYISSDISKNETLSENNIKIVRPGLGLLPKYYKSLLGKKVNKDLKAGTALKWDHIQ